MKKRRRQNPAASSLAWSVGARRSGALQAVLQCARTVVTGSNGLERLFDDLPALGRQLIVVEGGLIFSLNIILAALDLLDHSLVAAAECVAQILEAAMQVGFQRAIVVRSAAV